jgi:hypothetical protein
MRVSEDLGELALFMDWDAEAVPWTDTWLRWCDWAARVPYQ